MTASVVAVDQHSVTVQVQVTFDESMLLSEQNIQQALNEAGCLVLDSKSKTTIQNL